MFFNVVLAVIPIFLGFVLLSSKNKLLTYVLGACWLVFLPNSLYLFTDLLNLIKQWGRVNDLIRLVLLFQYGILMIVGLFTTVLGLDQFERFLQKFGISKTKKKTDLMIIILNFVIGFGITLGRIERVNSWHVITQPQSVLDSSWNILVSPQLLILTLLFGLFANLLYFTFRRPVMRLVNTYLSPAGARQ